MDSHIPTLSDNTASDGTAYTAEDPDNLSTYIQRRTRGGVDIAERVLYVLATGDHNHILRAAQWLRDTGWGTPPQRVLHATDNATGDVSLTELIKAAREARRTPVIITEQDKKH